MKKTLLTLIIAILTLVISTTFLIKGSQGYTGPAATIYVYPAVITATAAGQDFTVEIRIQNVTDLYVWSIGLTWNSSALECLNFNPDYSFFGPKENVTGLEGTINNTAGEIYPAYVYVLAGADAGVNGSGTLANATFRSKAAGTFNVHLAEPSLVNYNIETIPINMVGVFTAIWDSVAYPVITVSKITNESDYAYDSERCRIYNYAFNQPEKMISFNVAIPLEAIGPGSCNVTIPKNLLRANQTHPWTVKLDGNPISYSKAENATHTFIYLTYPQGTHQVQIIGTWVVPEFPTAIITLSLLLITTLTAALLRKMAWPTKRRKPTVTQQTS